jgi:hypothetical protein
MMCTVSKSLSRHVVFGLALATGCAHPSLPNNKVNLQVVPPAPAQHHESIADCPVLESHPNPPWDVASRVDCVRSARERVTVQADPTDGDGFRHFLDYEDVDGSHWRHIVTRPVGLALRIDGAIVVLDLKEGATLFDTAGVVVWRTQFPYCGALDSVAVGFDDTITFACGFSILRLDRNGVLLWSQFPFGNAGTLGPWVDRHGTLYVTGAGEVRALNPDGSQRWTLSTGTNRYVRRLGWLPNGDMTFQTSMNELHTRDDGSGIRFYYPYEDDELFETTRAGVVVRREALSIMTVPHWPRTWPIPADGAHRLD